MVEIWKDVVGYEDYFQVSNTGKIYSKRTNKELKYSVTQKGYCVFVTRFNGRNSPAKCFKIHILVAKAFIDNPENKLTVNHIDGNKLNNNVSNLEWATMSEQLKHAAELGLRQPKKGHDHIQSKLTKDDVKYIRENHHQFSSRKLAKLFNVSKTTILSIINGTRYTNN